MSRPAETATAPRRAQSGARAGLIVLAGVVVANAGNYAFQLMAARFLGPPPYGDLAALLAIVNLIALPLGAIQVWVARNVAEMHAVHDGEGIHWFVRRVGWYALLAAVFGSVVLFATSTLIERALAVHGLAAVMITALVVVPAVLTPVAWGLTQGLERYALLATLLAFAGYVAVRLLWRWHLLRAWHRRGAARKAA